MSRSLRFVSMDVMPENLRERVRGAIRDNDDDFRIQPSTEIPHESEKDKRRTPAARRKNEEHEQQVEFFQRIRALAFDHQDKYKMAAKRTYSIPNGGNRGKHEAYSLVQEGVVAGVSDIHCAVARGGKHGLYIEMKSRVGKASPKQVDWLLESEREGFEAHLCCSAKDAFEVWKAYVDS